MRTPVHLSSSAPYKTVNLAFQADAVTVINPTQNIILFRAGGTDVPRDPASADFWLPPYSAMSHPVQGDTFVVALGGQVFPVPVNTVYPDNVTVLFTGGETVPSYGSMPVGAISPGGVVIAIQPQTTPPSSSSRSRNLTFPVFAGVRSIAVTRMGDAVDSFTVVGTQSGRGYLNVGTIDRDVFGASTMGGWRFLIDTEVDSSVTVHTECIQHASVNDDGFSLFGYQERIAESLQNRDGRTRVDIFPPGVTALPITQALNTPNPSGSVVVGSGNSGSQVVLCDGMRGLLARYVINTFTSGTLFTTVRRLWRDGSNTVDASPALAGVGVHQFLYYPGAVTAAEYDMGVRAYPPGSRVSLEWSFSGSGQATVSWEGLP